jgi:hypothetical protein
MIARKRCVVCTLLEDHAASCRISHCPGIFSEEVPPPVKSARPKKVRPPKRPLTPEQRERKYEYDRRYAAKPENRERIKERKRQYVLRPDVKVRRRAIQRKYRERPEVQERIRQSRRIYDALPEVKERRRLRARECYRRKREAELASGKFRLKWDTSWCQPAELQIEATPSGISYGETEAGTQTAGT